jgi:hypothetical protein
MPFKSAEASRIYRTRWKREKYQKEHDALVAAMGGTCAECGTDERLEINHVDGWREYDLVQPGSLARIRRYRAEWEAWQQGEGPEVNLLCRKCNMVEMNNRRLNPSLAAAAQDDCPF